MLTEKVQYWGNKMETEWTGHVAQLQELTNAYKIF
jgi:hypothetical protein